jgi:hypothetical protein
MGKGIVKLGEGQWAVKDGNLLAAKETNGRFKNTEFTVSRGTRASYVGRDGLIKESNLQDVNLVNNGDFSELGSELVTNGAFDTDSDWGKSGGATISGGTGNIIGDGSSFTSLIKADVFTVGKTYKVTVDVTINSGLGLKFQDGSTNENFGFATTSGSYTFYGTANNADFVIGRRTGGTAFDSTVDNVSVKEVDPNDYWTFSGDSFTFPDGAARIARTTNTTFIQQNVLTSGKLYKVEFDVLDKDDNNGTFIVRLGSNNVYDVSTYEGTRFSKYITSAGVDFRIYSSSDNGVIYVDNIVVSEVKTDTPRIDFTDNTDGHLLLEPQSTNLVTYSEDFTDSSWTKLGAGTGSTAIVTPNYAISPDGTQNASRLQCDLNGGTTTSDQSLIYDLDSSNSSQSISIYMKSNNGLNQNIYFANTFTGDDRDTAIVTTEWKRFEFNHTTSNYTFSLGLRAATGCDDTADILIWAAQSEAIGYPTSYIPTNGSTVTRDAETCTGAGSSADFNSEEGVLYAEIAKFQDDNDNFVLLSLNNSSDNLDDNTVTIGFDSDDDFFIRVQANNVNVFYSNDQTSSKDVYYKIALSYKSGDSKIYINGNPITPNFGSLTGTFSFSSILDNLSFDYDGNGVLPFYGRVKAIRVYKEALSDTDLQNLTS